MARKVEWTDPAWEDLADIVDYIARDSEYYAAAFVQEVKDTAASLTDFAERGQIVPEWDETSVRELLIKSYRLIYRIFDERIVILALIHGARRSGR